MAGVATVSAQAASADETTVSVDASRNAWKSDQAGLTPSALPSINETFRIPLTGAVLAQPVVFGSTVIVATENDWVYGVDRTTGDVKWSRTVGNPEPSSAVGCNDISPSYGVTSTPVVDPTSGTVYVSARTWDGSNVNSAQQRIFALNASTGSVQPGWPVVVQGTASNDGTTGFNPVLEFQRPGLLLLNGRVWAGFASMCDLGDYRGWVVGVSAASRSQTRWVDEANPGGGEANILGGIWQSGGGLASDPDRPGSIFLTSGNGTVPPPGPGTHSNALGQSVVRLQVQPDGTVVDADHFSPFNADKLNGNDDDMGSSAGTMLPDNFGGVTGHPHLTFQGSKGGTYFLLDRDNLGGRGVTTDAGRALAVLGSPPGTGATWSHGAVWPGDGGYVYLTPSDRNANGMPLQAFRVSDGAGHAALSVAGTTPDNIGGVFPGSPVVTSDGTTSGSAVVWVIARSPNELRAYNAVPDVNGILQPLKSFSIGTAAKFSVPATDGNQVFVGTQDGQLFAFSSASPQCTIYTSPATGSHRVCGAIRTKYEALGGPSGVLGYPTTDETITPDGIGRFNHFANSGSIYWTPGTGAQSIRGAIRAKWASLGWELSFLGYPVTDETGAPDGVGRFNHFSNSGSIYWTPNTGAWSIHGLIRAKYLAMGGPASFIGYPVTDETGTPDGVGRFNHFSSTHDPNFVDGSIYWTPATGAWSIHGAIRAKWASLGWELSFLGYPVTDETPTPDGVGRFNHFSQSGSIYWTPATGAWSIHGRIRDKWASMGWERSCLGYPVSDEFGIPGGRQSNFQRGVITYSFSSGQATSSC